MRMRVLPMGPDALLVELEDQADVLGLHAEILRRLESEDGWPWPRPSDVVPAARTVLIDGLADPAPIAAALPTWPVVPLSAPEGRIVHCPTVYDGPDLEAVAVHWGVSRSEAIALHTSTEFVVAFCGFAPGFAYLTGLPADRWVPRRETPRTQVPAGSVALAGEYSAVYPSRSPGGWQLIGRTELVLWDPGGDPAALPVPGDRVRFEAVEP
ncbi:MAG TPA: allophanate hydrolase subunit 1 [Solirubrobacteraceae bacterium]|nr:allophanate hydrolase subunit 1 [Solirubrobacteraceae bacterium]